jgi:hypothetical protein
VYKRYKDNLGREDPEARCLPPGVPRMSTTPYPWTIVQTPQLVVIVYEGGAHVWRKIFMDGRGHDPTVELTWLGDSIGRWDGDTLVVDTTNFTDQTRFVGSGTGLRVLSWRASSRGLPVSVLISVVLIALAGCSTSEAPAPINVHTPVRRDSGCGWLRSLPYSERQREYAKSDAARACSPRDGDMPECIFVPAQVPTPRESQP